MSLTPESARALVSAIILHGIITDRTPAPDWTMDDGISEAIHVTDKLLFQLDQMPVGMSEVPAKPDPIFTNGPIGSNAAASLNSEETPQNPNGEGISPNPVF